MQLPKEYRDQLTKMTKSPLPEESTLSRTEAKGNESFMKLDSDYKMSCAHLERMSNDLDRSAEGLKKSLELEKRKNEELQKEIEMAEQEVQVKAMRANALDEELVGAKPAKEYDVILLLMTLN